MSRKFFYGCFIVFSSVLFGLIISAQADLTAALRTETRLYQQPDALAPSFATLDAETDITILGRTEIPMWVLIEAGELSGWMPAGVVALSENVTLLDLPVRDSVVAIPDGTEVVIAETMRAYTEDERLLGFMDMLLNTPIFYNMDTDTLDAIFAEGRALGNRADVFTKVGDSDTTSGDYLQPIGLGAQYCELGSYDYLQATIDLYSTPPLNGIRTSFSNTSVAAINGLTMVAALDPFWTDSPACNNGESPLACEYRLVEPSVSVIMLGRMDVTYFDAAFYRENAVRVIEDSISRGVIPILTTFVVLPDNFAWENSIEFNATLVDLATEYDIPLINLWRAVQPLPRFGIGPDLTHLHHQLDQFCNFTGAETELGGTLRNLLTLQALDLIRQSTLNSE
ncbi:MAG: SGNH/GDSL hydrolase family protein [Aggregatilineales bacterium]